MHHRIIYLKGREPSFLQSFHHAGIVIIMWCTVVTRNNVVGFVTVLFNSFIHSIMYTYYVFAALGYSSTLKHYLTQAQLVQFLTGIVLIIPTMFFQCSNQAQSVCTYSILTYTAILIYLFLDFYQTTYRTKGVKAA